MSGVQVVDRTGQPRRPEEFVEARAAVVRTMLDFKFMAQFPALAVHMGAVADALSLAAAVAEQREKTVSGS